MSKNILIPSISGEFISLRQLAELSNIPYSKLFYWQNEFNILPSFELDGCKAKRYDKNGSLPVIAWFVELREKSGANEAKAELLKTSEYKRLEKKAKLNNVVFAT